MEQGGHAEHQVGAVVLECDRLLEHPGIEHVIYRRSPTLFVVATRTGKVEIAVGPNADGASIGNPTLELAVTGDDPLGYGGLPSVMAKNDVSRLTADTASSIDEPPTPQGEEVEITRQRVVDRSESRTRGKPHEPVYGIAFPVSAQFLDVDLRRDPLPLPLHL